MASAPPTRVTSLIDLDGTPGPGELTQSFATTPGQTYELSFAYANNFLTVRPLSLRERVRQLWGSVGANDDFPLYLSRRRLELDGLQRCLHGEPGKCQPRFQVA